MRLRRLPKNFQFVACHVLPDLPRSARVKLERISLIQRLASSGSSVTQACALVGVPRSTYYRWRARAKRGALALADGRARSARRRRAPAREAHREAILTERAERRLGKAKLAVTLARRGVSVSASTIQRVLREAFENGTVQRLGYAGRSTGRRRRAAKRAHAERKRSGVRPRTAGELVQIDTLHEHSIPGRPRYQFTAVDPTERHLHAQLYTRPSSRNAAAFLHELRAAFPVPITSIQVDNGSEFMGAFESACQHLGIALYTIPPATPKANAKVERAQRASREEHYAFEPPAITLDEHRAALAAYVHHYNHYRPHQALGYLTPNEYNQRRNPNCPK